MEEQARQILRDALERDLPQSLADLARQFFGAEHGVELELHPRVTPSPPPRFEP